MDEKNSSGKLPWEVEDDAPQDIGKAIRSDTIERIPDAELDKARADVLAAYRKATDEATCFRCGCGPINGWYRQRDGERKRLEEELQVMDRPWSVMFLKQHLRTLKPGCSDCAEIALGSGSLFEFNYQVGLLEKSTMRCKYRKQQEALYHKLRGQQKELMKRVQGDLSTALCIGRSKLHLPPTWLDMIPAFATE